MEEYLDIINTNGEIVGKEEKHKAHLQGLWHRTFHCWLVSDGSIVLQLRAKAKNNHPNKFDISAAGHVSAGEDVLEGGLRELEEELGLNVSVNDFTFAGIVVQAGDEQTPKGFYKNREQAHTYFVQNNTPLEKYKLQDEELDGVYKINPQDLMDLFTGEKATITVHGFSFINANMQADARDITTEDFVDHMQGYYIKIAIMAQRFIEGKSVAV